MRLKFPMMLEGYPVPITVKDRKELRYVRLVFAWAERRMKNRGPDYDFEFLPDLRKKSLSLQQQIWGKKTPTVKSRRKCES